MKFNKKCRQNNSTVGSSLADKVLVASVDKLNVARECILAVIKTKHRPPGCVRQRVAYRLRTVLTLLCSPLLILHPE